MCTSRTVAAAVLPYHCAMVMTLPLAVDFERFHSHEVVSWLAEGRGRPGAAQLGAGRSLTIRLADGAGPRTDRRDGPTPSSAPSSGGGGPVPAEGVRAV